MNAIQHHTHMSLALRLARQGCFTVSPNPMVGCVIVKNNQVIGSGYHQRAGEAHAEIFALKEAGKEADGASAYITLEPCCHQGKTPPCTTALISAGIKKVYVSGLDPNPLINGKGIATLRSAGIQVEMGWCEAEAEKLNEIFFYYIKNKRPFVIAKWAMSLDGKTKVNSADNKQISCSKSQHHTHHLRQQVDAILVGAHTACQDNPQLTARLATNNEINKQPIRIVLSGHRPFPADLKLWHEDLPGKTILVVTKSNQHLFKNISNKSVEQLIIPENESHQIALPILLDELGKKNITSLLVEGGMTVHENFMQENLVNSIQVYLSPVIIGSFHQKQPLNILDFSQNGNDFILKASFKEGIHV